MTNDDTWLTVKELAERVGPRRGSRPTSPGTVRRWMREGARGVILFSELDIGSRKTTWGHYLAFRAAVQAAAQAEKERRLQAARDARGWRKRQERARAFLEARGAG